MILKTELFPHQAAAVEKLSKIKIGALYMEMGTGKTRTALELIKRRMDAGKVDHVLWLCPCSVKQNLLSDIEKHSDLAEMTICGIETLSSSVRENVRLLQLVQSKKVYLIVDESSLVKNPSALRSKNITRLADKCQYKLILNGTPISKCEADLFSQWFLLDWRILGYKSFWSFAANHLEYDEKFTNKIRRVLNVGYLTDKIAPYTYQIKKDECVTLPKKAYSAEPFLLTPEQDEHYDYVADKLMFDLDEMQPESIYKLFGALQAVTSGFAIRIDHDLKTERYPFFLNPKDNPRIKTLTEVLGGEAEKVIIYCNYVQEIIEIDGLLNKSCPGSSVVFYGDINQKKRQENREKFRDDAQYFVTNKRCGAYGLNLQFCHKIIYYSHDWDWGTRAQSEDRVHRIGQTEEVTITDIYAARTIDRQILDCLDRKENLVDKFKTKLGEKGKKEAFNNFIRGGNHAEDLQKRQRNGSGARKISYRI